MRIANPAIVLRVAAVVTLLFAAGHLYGGLASWSPAGETEVLQQMRSFHFDVEGVSRTHLELYLGFGLLLGVYLLLQAVVLWQLTGLARTQPRRVAGIVLGIFVASAGAAVLAWMYILPTPAIFSTVVAACVGLAYISVRSDQTQGRA